MARRGRSILAVAVACLSLVVACDQIFGIDSPNAVDWPSESGAGDAAGDAGSEASTTVTGTQVHWYQTDLGPAQQPVDFTSVPIAANVLLADGGVDTYPGSGLGNGSFTIPNVPPGALYYLHVKDINGLDSYVYSHERALALDDWTFGRPSQQAPDAGPDGSVATQLTLNITGMDPWNANDALEIGSSNAGLYVYGPEQDPSANGPPNALDTSASVSLAHFERTPGARLVAPNDSFYAYQLEVADAGSLPGQLSVMGPFAMFSGVTIQNGANNVIDASLVPDAGTLSTTVTWDRNQFGQYGGSINPNASIGQQTIGVDVSPGKYGSFGPDLWLYTFTSPDLGTDTFGLTVRNPFPPAQWTPVGIVWTFITVPITVPLPDGGTFNTQVAGTFVCAYDMASFTGTLKPLVSPPQQPLINGKNIFNANSLPTTTPTLSWMPPAAGTPTQYVVTLFEIIPTGAPGHRQAQIAKIYTTETQVTLPQGLMQQGHYYYFRFGSFFATGTNMQAKPLLSSPPMCLSQAVSGVQTP